jgi:phage shock protein A
VTDYTDSGIPTLAYLQDKIERRYATAFGAHELAEATIPEAADAAKRQEQLAKSAKERLEEIRRSLHPDA